ncbi:hypothetical protein PPYR_08166 [Photinus pyralis]|uniref:Cytochrome P450 n=1 Tax=Photinus pyralis TaxID=7054 RepID=A0A5N4AIK2_PHOPY|nr:probable cytochrome P450 6a14 [Photinus pyralis]KAB0797172.1 hypothetical protein PPYR_08166 [Photinus pyralis]
MACLIVCALVAALAVLVTAYIQWGYTYWKRRGLPHIPPTFPYGNYEPIFSRKQHFGEWAKSFYDQFKSRGVKHAGLYVLSKPIYLPIATDYVKNVLQNDFRHFVNRGTYYNEKDDPLSAHLFNLSGQKWRDLRTKLTPTFTSGKMKRMFNTLLDCTVPMREAVASHCVDGTPVMIKEVIARFTTDVIGSCAFGLECNSFKDDDAAFRHHGRALFNTQDKLNRAKRGLANIFPTLSRMLGVALLPKESTQFFFNAVRDTIQHREKNNVVRNDMLQILIELQKSNKESGKPMLTMEQMAAEAFVFFIAGFETSSSVTTLCLYELARNEDIQNKVREEIESTLRENDDEITYEAVMGMKYLDQVVNETMRLYPSLTFLTRECVQDYPVPDTDVVIEKNTLVVIPSIALHKDPEFWDNPEAFDPEHFSAENTPKITPFTYMPFGEGPRTCIGMRFGTMQVKVGLTTLLKDYAFSVCSKTVPPVLDKYLFISNTRDPVWLNVRKIT